VTRDNDTLTRVYGTAFASESDLKEHLELREEALERDHRKIGQEMNLFSIPTVTGPGLPLYHPPGKTVLRELSNFANELNRENGYEEVERPARVPDGELEEVRPLRELQRRHVPPRRQRRRSTGSSR